MAYYHDDTLEYEEDVPSDFFDDFSNQDFMAGLDVVDAWDDEDEEVLSKTTERPSHHHKLNKVTTTRRPPRRRIRNKNKRPKSRTPVGRKKINDKLKRDPEKSKRDIQKDKDKWNKNKEAKIISEKLKVVETGLVPPGTEMELDVVEKPTHVADLREKLRKRSRSTSFDLTTRLAPERRNRSRDNRRSPPFRRNRSRTRSPQHHAGLLQRSSGFGHQMSPNRRSGSPRRVISPHRSMSPRRTSIEWRAKQFGRFRDISPNVRRRYNRSRSPQVSERDLWLRNRNYHRKRTESPPSMDDRRKNVPRDFLEELADKLQYDEKKKSFLKEIGHKLNEPTRSNHPRPPNQPHPPNHPHPPNQQMFMPAPGPGMVMMPGPGAAAPANNFYQPPPAVDPAPQYDQSFFIGQPNVFQAPNQNPNLFPTMYPQGNFNSNVQPSIVPQPVNRPPDKKYNIPFSPSTNKTIVPLNSVSTEIQKQQDKIQATKLLEDKTITLSDYLSMSVHHDNDSVQPINIHKKVKVLAQCQDAIKAMGNASKLNGRFFYTKGKSVEKPADIKCLSPLRKIPVTRFSYTTPWKGGEEKTGLQTPLQKLLTSIGLSLKVSPTEQVDLESTGMQDPSVVELPKLSPPVKLMTPSVISVRFQTKMVQTVPVKCGNCEKRSAIKFTSSSSQCNIKTVDSGTQITDEDSYRYGLNTLTNIGKNKSLAHLTPAQLLGKDDQQQKVFHGKRMLTTPPPPNISPEKLGMRAEYPSRRAPNVPHIPSLIEQLQSSMKAFDANSVGRQNFLDPSNDIPIRVGNTNRDPYVPAYNRPSEFKERTPPFLPLRSDDLRGQQLRPVFEPPDNRDYYSQHEYGGRKYF